MRGLGPARILAGTLQVGIEAGTDSISLKYVQEGVRNISGQAWGHHPSQYGRNRSKVRTSPGARRLSKTILHTLHTLIEDDDEGNLRVPLCVYSE